MVMREMACKMVLNGVYVQPAALQKTDYIFLYPELEPALKTC